MRVFIVSIGGGTQTTQFVSPTETARVSGVDGAGSCLTHKSVHLCAAVRSFGSLFVNVKSLRYNRLWSQHGIISDQTADRDPLASAF